MPDADNRTVAKVYEVLGARLSVYGHIHRPFVREMAGPTVANSGSVGMPYDGDPRASYLLIENRRVSVRRVEYDVEQEITDLVATGYPYADWLADIRRHGIYVPPPQTREG